MKSKVAPQIRKALDEGQPVVALESTLITHGFPRPVNLLIALELEARVRAAGAVPATIGVVRGRPTIGLSREEIQRFAESGPEKVRKLSVRDLGTAMAQELDGSTTVAATMRLAHLAGIRVLATGGIGGVHRGGESSMDVSADLLEIARTPVTVVCAGAKSILDIRRTLEVLETHGVPVITVGADDFPGFYLTSSGVKSPLRIDDVEQLARAVNAHFAFPTSGGVLVAQPLPPEKAIAPAQFEAWLSTAVAEATARGLQGAHVTPFLLGRLHTLSSGNTETANSALLFHNAALAARLAAALL